MLPSFNCHLHQPPPHIPYIINPPALMPALALCLVFPIGGSAKKPAGYRIYPGLVSISLWICGYIVLYLARALPNAGLHGGKLLWRRPPVHKAEPSCYGPGQKASLHQAHLWP